MMLRKFFTLVFLMACNYSQAQYYSVNDKDGYVNVRSRPDINAEILYQLPNSKVIYETYDEDSNPKSNWLHAFFYLPEKSINKGNEDYTPEIMNGYTLYSGYIYRSKLTTIEKLKQLNYKQLKNGYFSFNDSIKVSVLITPFIGSKHKIKYQDGFFEKVDNLPMMGTDGDKPRDEIKAITISVNSISIDIPSKSFKNLFNPSFNNYTYTDDNGTIYLVMYNSDAAGSYSCIFIFRNGRFVERLVFMGDC